MMIDVKEAPVLRLSSVEQRVEAETNELHGEDSVVKESENLDVSKKFDAYEIRRRRAKYFDGKQGKLQRRASTLQRKRYSGKKRPRKFSALLTRKQSVKDFLSREELQETITDKAVLDNVSNSSSNASGEPNERRFLNYARKNEWSKLYNYLIDHQDFDTEVDSTGPNINKEAENSSSARVNNNEYDDFRSHIKIPNNIDMEFNTVKQSGGLDKIEESVGLQGQVSEHDIFEAKKQEDVAKSKNIQKKRKDVLGWVKDKKGSSLLTVAAAYNNVDTMLVLYGIGAADLEAKNKNGLTPLCVAARYGRVDAVRVLLKFGASQEVRTKRGHTPLIIAANQITRAVKAEDRKFYRDLVETCQEFIERTNNDGQRYIDEFTRQDHRHNKIKDGHTAAMILEWIHSKGEMRDLHIPPFSTFQNSKSNGNANELRNFFSSKHENVDYVTWSKIVLLLVFIYYDFVYGTHNIKLYVVLYILAYAL